MAQRLRHNKITSRSAIVQHALRSTATASTVSSAIDVLGDALLEPERLVANTSVLMY